MLRNYLRTALRGMKRHPGYAAINILGLSLGLVVSFMILLWVQDETGHDQFYGKAEDVYHVIRTVDFGGQISTTESITAMLDDVLDENYPEIEYGAMLGWEAWSSFVKVDSTSGSLAFRNMVRYVGPNFFKILTFDFLAGDPETALVSPETVVMSEKMARMYFPEVFEAHTTAVAASEALVGQTILLENRLLVTITGIVEDAPALSSIKYDAFLAYEEYARRNSWINGWGNNGFRMVVRLANGASGAAVSEKIKNVVKENQEGSTAELFLHPITKRYLWSEWEDGVLTGGRIEYVRIMGVFGLLILLIAAINFTNLATARSAQRAMEIGIRKTFGGSRKGLAGQFLFESVFTAFVSFMVALGAVWLLLGSFNALTEKSISLLQVSASTWLLFIGITGFTGLLAGIYPALFLSGFGIMKVLRARSVGGAGSGNLRRALVVFQFGVSIVLIVGTMTIYNQMSLIRTQNLGFSRENVVSARLEGGAREQFESFKATLKQNPAILDVTTADDNPYNVNTSTTDPDYDGKDPDDNSLFYMVASGYDYLKTLKMELVAGRDFTPDQRMDSANVIINETAAKKLGFDNPIGQRFAVWGQEGVIIGVVKDFNMLSMYEEIQPTIIRFDPQPSGLYFVRSAPGGEKSVVETMLTAFAQFSPGYPFNERFMDDEYNEMYQSEQVIETLSNWFALIAILIACLGLYGLAAFTTSRRTKEIGVRKVLGASASSVVGLLTKEFAMLVGVAFVIAAPTAWWIMNEWLSKFEYRAELNWGLFAIAGLGMVAITYATVGFQSLRAALVNPSDALRTE
jgi:putative ABC transport system permease protein